MGVDAPTIITVKLEAMYICCSTGPAHTVRLVQLWPHQLSVPKWACLICGVFDVIVHLFIVIFNHCMNSLCTIIDRL